MSFKSTMYLVTVVVFLVRPPQRVCEGLTVSPQSAGRSVVTDGLGRPHSHVTCLTRRLASGKLSWKDWFLPRMLLCVPARSSSAGGFKDTQRIAMRSKA